MRSALAFLICCAVFAAAVHAAETGDVPGPLIDKPLLLHRTFDDAQPATRGVYGGAAALRDTHKLGVPAFGVRILPKIAFSVWVRPASLGGYRELFRQEGANRILFSFQQDGTILSLGLDIGGYIECDAPLEPDRALDGNWHHCAATFDGKAMAVYFDGRLLTTMERPGVIACDPDVPAFIGSMNGTSEHLQGDIDDLRIYSDALTPEEIASIYRNGREGLDRYAKQIENDVNALYAPGASFAETLANCRSRIFDNRRNSDPDLAHAVAAKLKESFPKESADFAEWTRSGTSDWLVLADAAEVENQVGLLVDLLLEYKPLTKDQWKRQSPDDLRKWEEAARIEQRYNELETRGEPLGRLADWINLILEIGPRIQLRPYASEAVAPYVKPATPVTRDLTADEARQALESDWLHQADGNPTPDRIKKEIAWARDLIARLAAAGAPEFSRSIADLAALEQRADALAAPDVNLYFEVRRIKRDAMLRNPVVDFDKILLVDMPYPQGSEWPHETRHRLGYMAVPGGRLIVLEGLRPDGHLRQIMPQAPLHGSFWRPDLSFDAKKVLVCFKPHNEKSFHLYEVELDGSNLEQLTDGPYDDLDPIYLPDGAHVLFSTTRGHTYVRCMPPTNAYILARADCDGKNIYIVSANNEPDYLPSVMNDGRVVYTRWEYTDKPLWRLQKLWTINPDGTQVATFWGNQSVWPDVVKDARSIPGSRRVMVTGSAHHNWFSGSIAIIDPESGYNYPKGIAKITADVPWPEVGNGPADPVESPNYHASGDYPAYYSPFPLGEKDFLVSAAREGKFRLYLMDVDGNRELIYEGVNNALHAMPVRPRIKPPVIHDRVKWPSPGERDRPEPGVLYSSNLYEGAPPELEGKVRALRVLQIDPKTYTYWNKRPYISTGPVVSAVQSDGVKRILGTVPVESDGSFAFYAPPGRPLHVQLLDENGRALQTMRSFVGLMPGERRGCVGCHEMHSRAPQIGGRPIALAKEPAEIAPPPWGDETVGYPRFVQPVLDQYCGKCHEGDGEARKTLDLTERPGAPIFTEPYLTLIGRPTWGAPYRAPAQPPPGFGIADTLIVEGFAQTDPAGYATPKPMTCLSYKSRLIEMASSGKHHGVQVDPLSLQKLIAWVDTMCPYCGDEEIRQLPDPEFQGVEWLAVRPLIKTAPTIPRPGPVD